MNKVKVKSIKMKNRDGFITNKEELIFSAQKIFNFSFLLSLHRFKLYKYKELEEVNIYYLPIELCSIEKLVENKNGKFLVI